MLDEQLRHKWRARKRAVPIEPVLNLAPEGLVLGAGTVLIAADGARRLRSLKGQEARVLALLSAGYGKAVAPAVLGNIERAAKCWREGDDCLAYIHLAHARLSVPPDPYAAARRLFIADALMKAGTNPRDIFKALNAGTAYIDAVEKAYNPAEPRVPAGAAGRAVSGPTARKRAQTTLRERERPERARKDHLCSAECPSRQPAFWRNSTQRKWRSLVPMLRAFLALVLSAPPWPHLVYCSSRLPITSVLKVRCRRYRGCDIPGIATRLNFI